MNYGITQIEPKAGATDTAVFVDVPHQGNGVRVSYWYLALS